MSDVCTRASADEGSEGAYESGVLFHRDAEGFEFEGVYKNPDRGERIVEKWRPPGIPKSLNVDLDNLMLHKDFGIRCLGLPLLGPG
ncbi:MAG TPA: hypothetical protein DIW47_09165 [Bacteroidetes bacterium]|nr:hypothetical protein [Bacteroidota bacterium]